MSVRCVVPFTTSSGLIEKNEIVLKLDIYTRITGTKRMIYARRVKFQKDVNCYLWPFPSAWDLDHWYFSSSTNFWSVIRLQISLHLSFLVAGQPRQNVEIKVRHEEDTISWCWFGDIETWTWQSDFLVGCCHVLCLHSIDFQVALSLNQIYCQAHNLFSSEHVLLDRKCSYKWP